MITQTSLSRGTPGLVLSLSYWFDNDFDLKLCLKAQWTYPYPMAQLQTIASWYKLSSWEVLMMKSTMQLGMLSRAQSWVNHNLIHLRRCPKPVLLKVWLLSRRERGKTKPTIHVHILNSLRWRETRESGSHPQIQFGHFFADKKESYFGSPFSLPSHSSPYNILALAGRPACHRHRRIVLVYNTIRLLDSTFSMQSDAKDE